MSAGPTALDAARRGLHLSLWRDVALAGGIGCLERGRDQAGYRLTTTTGDCP
jgi:hypothetical protein